MGGERRGKYRKERRKGGKEGVEYRSERQEIKGGVHRQRDDEKETRERINKVWEGKNKRRKMGGQKGEKVLRM